MKTKIFIENLARDASEDDVVRYFGNYTKVIGSFVPLERNSVKNQGFGFIEVENYMEAEKIVRQLNGSVIMSNNIRLSLAPRRLRSSGVNPIVEKVILPKKR